MILVKATLENLCKKLTITKVYACLEKLGITDHFAIAACFLRNKFCIEPDKPANAVFKS